MFDWLGNKYNCDGELIQLRAMYTYIVCPRSPAWLLITSLFVVAAAARRGLPGWFRPVLDWEADLSMFSMFGRTGARKKRTPQARECRTAAWHSVVCGAYLISSLDAAQHSHGLGNLRRFVLIWVWLNLTQSYPRLPNSESLSQISSRRKTEYTAFHDRRPSVPRRCGKCRKNLEQSAIRSDIVTVSAYMWD